VCQQGPACRQAGAGDAGDKEAAIHGRGSFFRIGDIRPQTGRWRVSTAFGMRCHASVLGSMSGLCCCPSQRGRVRVRRLGRRDQEHAGPRGGRRQHRPQRAVRLRGWDRQQRGEIRPAVSDFPFWHRSRFSTTRASASARTLLLKWRATRVMTHLECGDKPRRAGAPSPLSTTPAQNLEISGHHTD